MLSIITGCASYWSLTFHPLSVLFNNTWLPLLSAKNIRVIDAVSRLIDGVLSSSECYEGESVASGILEYPQYTRPYEFHGVKVPDVLLSGHHAKIAEWRAAEALRITKEKRPDLLDKISK